MQELTIRLFGRVSVRRDAGLLDGLEGRKVQELFCYLLTYRNRPHPREGLATLLWGDVPTAQSRSYLRKALWQLQTALAAAGGDGLLQVDAEWVQLQPDGHVLLDVAVFEGAYAMSRSVPGRELDVERARCLGEAVELYTGELLEGWYSEWCLYERERLQQLNLTMLDKLVGHCEARGDFESGIAYADRLLHWEPAHESTYQHLMRMHYLAGDRTAALRTYERCLNVLCRELNVDPDPATIALYEQIRSNQLPRQRETAADHVCCSPASLADVLAHLRDVQSHLADLQVQVQQGILAVEQMLPA